MKSYKQVEEELAEAKTGEDLTKTKVKDGSFSSFKIVGNPKEFFLAIIDRKGFGGIIQEFAYVSKDKKEVIHSIFSGGDTGGGTEPRKIQKLNDKNDEGEMKFIQFVK